MTRSKLRHILYNCILSLALLAMLGVSLLGGNSITSLALEQPARCGMQEHTHSGDCYLGGVLLCNQKAHLHTEDCYLVRLQDNDINWLLETIESTEQKSLESVIDSALVQALHLNQSLTGEERQTVYLVAENINEINRIIAAEEIQPSVVLNENLSDEHVLMYTPPVEEECPEDPAGPVTPTVTTPPVESIYTPTEGTVRPTEAPAEPTEETTEPTEETTEPTEETTEPTEETTEPTEETTGPTEETTEPTEETTEPTEATTEPTEETTAPTEETTEPTEETTAPTEETTEPTEETTAPTEESTEPTEETTEPTEETTEPTEETTEPTEETTEPTEETTEPTEETTEPTEETTEPTEETTEPTEETTEPTEETTEPTEETTEPIEETTEPTEETTEPTEETTEPTEETTEPTEETTEPTEETTEPTEETTEPTEETTEPTEAPTEPIGPVPQYGEVGIYILADEQWICVDVVEMEAQAETWGTNYTIESQRIREALRSHAVVSDNSLRENLVQTVIAPPEGLEHAAGVINDTIYIGADGSPQHFLLATSHTEQQEYQQKRIFTPVEYHTVILMAEDGSEERLYIQSGEPLGTGLSGNQTWRMEDGTSVTAETVVQEPMILRAASFTEEPGATVTDSADSTESVKEPAPSGETEQKLAMGAAGRDVLSFALQSSSDASTYAVGGSASGATRAINFYIKLDGTVTFVNSASLTYNNDRSEQSRKEYCTYETAADAYTGTAGLVTGLTADQIGGTYYFRYNTRGAASNFSSNPTYANSKVYFNNTNDPQYAILTSNTSGAQVAFYTVTLDRSAVGGDTEVFYVEENLIPDLGMEFDQYNWYRGDTEITQAEAITEKTTYVAQKKHIQASFEAPDNTQLKPAQTGTDGSQALTVTLPSLADTPYSGWLWVEKDSDSSGYESDGSVTITITDSTVFTVVPKWYTVTLHQGEDTTTENIRYREDFTFPALPDGYTWRDQAGEEYAGGSTFLSVTENLSFYAADRVISLYYHVNFTDSNVTQIPTLVDSADQYYGEEHVLAGQSTVAKSVTPRNPARSINATNESVVYLFQGWKITGTDTIIEPGARLTWQELDAWADSSGSIELTGQWLEGGNLRSANFYIRYDSVAVDVGGNLTSSETNLYTPSLHSTFVGGLDGYENSTKSQLNAAFAQTDTTADNSYSVDQRIRSLYGIRSEGIWLYDFPTDEAVFEYLRNDPNVSNLRIGGEVVPIDQLSTEYYAVRWYVFKKEDSSWHADGKLVPREGHITISKQFNGDPAAVAAAKNDFYILAGTDGRTERLTLPNTTDNYFEWKITGVHLGEQWNIQEYASTAQGYSYYAESLVYDTDGEMQPISRNGTQVTVTGKAYAIDVDPNQGMMVDFTNYYYNKDSILIKKEDAQTGRPIGGAAFQLFQNGSMISFDYDQSTGTYNRNPDGTGAHTQIVTKADGFSIISTTGFSYNMGDVTVREVVAPAGYDPAPDITLGDNGSGTVVLKDVDGVAQDLWFSFAEVPNNDTLIVKDRVSEQISVTVEKIWDASQSAASVDVVLQANGENAAAVFPGFANAQVRLSGDNNWTYTWTQLPRVADGTAVTWSVKEVAVGSESALADGSFPSWTAIHSPGRAADADGDGDVDEWYFTITNTQRRTQLIVIKTDGGNTTLKGAAFTLQQVRPENGTWKPVSGSITTSQTTNNSGHLNFDSLVTNANYLLTETNPPAGYGILTESIVLSIDQVGQVWQVAPDGTRTAIDAPGIHNHGSYTIRVENQPLVNLPETGGTGTRQYTICGSALMLAAVYMILVKRRKEGRNTS